LGDVTVRERPWLYNRCVSQRLRLTYRKHGPARYVAHLDLMRTWERAIRRARLPLVYSQGFSPHPRISMAAPLPVGTAGEAELLDIWLDPPVGADETRARLSAALPTGIDVVAAGEVEARTPALQAASAAGRYEVRFALAALPAPRLAEAMAVLLARDTLDWEETRGGRTRRYDLRAAILDGAVRVEADATVLELRLSLRPGNSTRPSSVLAALGFGDVEPLLTTRLAIELGEAVGDGSSGDELEGSPERDE
jgi:radical SAM-linked protein